MEYHTKIQLIDYQIFTKLNFHLYSHNEIKVPKMEIVLF